MATSISFAALAILVATATLLENTSATTYTVGDNLGWRVPSDAAAYATWASQQTFTVGDVLVFDFATGTHNVARVTKGDFDACNSTNPISLNAVGPANITLGSTGEEYFFCTVGQHCSLGQKLAINVTAALRPSPSPAPSPSIMPPSPGPTGVATPPPSATQPPESGSPPESLPPPSSGGNVSPPPPPNAGPTAAVASIFVIFISAAIGIMF